MTERPYPDSPLASRGLTQQELETELAEVQRELDRPMWVVSDNAENRRKILRRQRDELQSALAQGHTAELSDVIGGLFEPPGNSALHPSQRPR